MSFIALNTLEKLDDLFEKSNETPVVLFKHSVTCPISTNVYDEISAVAAEINVVVVQSDRPISNEIATRTNVRHESPQAIILRAGKPVYYAAHYDVTAADIEEILTTNA